MTLEQLGGRISPPVDKGTVSRWENAAPGKLTLGVIAAYAEALDRHPAEMYRMPADPSLDAMVSGLDDDAKSRAFGYVEGLKGRKAS